ncbi:MAG: hypothetical protein ABI954_10880 [Pyrinomonadaceae bacterium]
MINQLNLSSRPFRNRTLPWILAAVGLAVSFFAAFFVLVEYQKVNNQTKAVKAEINEIDPKIKALKTESDKIRQSLTPEQQVLLRSAHSLVDRRRFSWSRLFADLESVLPRDVRVSNVGIRDVVDQGGGRMLAELDFSVMSKDYQSVNNMLNEMNNSGKFQGELRAQDLQSDKGNLTEYSIQLRYLPSAGVPVAPETSDIRPTTAQNKLMAEVNN